MCVCGAVSVGTRCRGAREWFHGICRIRIPFFVESATHHLQAAYHYSPGFFARPPEPSPIAHHKYSWLTSVERQDSLGIVILQSYEHLGFTERQHIPQCIVPQYPNVWLQHPQQLLIQVFSPLFTRLTPNFPVPST